MERERLAWSRVLPRLAPLALPFAALFLGGFVLALLQSLGLALGFPYESGLLDAYRAVLRPRYLASFAFSLWVALASAGISTLAGALLATQVWKLPALWQRPALIYKIPLILPHIAVGFIVLTLLSRTGFAASLAFHLGLIDKPAEFPSLLYTGGLGMILAYVYKETPFALLMALAVLRRLDPRLPQTARMLGASRTRVFLRVVLPHMAPALHAVFIILFLYTFGAFEIPFLLGQSRPDMLSIEVYNSYFQRGLEHRPAAMALLALMFFFSAAFIALYSRIVRRLDPRERKL